MKTTIFILGSNNYWYSTTEVEYKDSIELNHLINDAIAEVRNNITDGVYDDCESLNIILGEVMFSNL